MFITSRQERTNWRDDIAPYQKSNTKKSIWQLLNTLVPFFGLWYLAYVCYPVSIWLTLAITIPAAGFLVRTFIIFHDCGHHAFFTSRKANEFWGTVTGLLTFFPYHQWKYEHGVHHAGNGNLDRRGMGDITTLTVDEYMQRSPFQRLCYRLYRNPVVMFGLGPIFIVLIRYRVNRKTAGRKERANTHITTAILIAVSALSCFAFGWERFLLIEGPILYLSGMAGIWLFYVQHQFEDSYFEKTDQWGYVDAALHGSSFYKLPRVLQWFTGNIGYHHIHHLGPRIPNYNLQPLFQSQPYLQNVPTIGLRTSLSSLRFRLWDEETKRFLGFRSIVSRKAKA